jgi:hypothetical protein
MRSVRDEGAFSYKGMIYMSKFNGVRAVIVAGLLYADPRGLDEEGKFESRRKLEAPGVASACHSRTFKGEPRW